MHQEFPRPEGIFVENVPLLVGADMHPIYDNLGGRDELTRMVRKIAALVKDGEIAPEDITENMIEESLDTAGLPDPDLMIRTSYELRISNYLLWQLAYAEFYFTEVPWPDFDEKELQKAVGEYGQRERRFGKV